jgi:acetyl esterase
MTTTPDPEFVKAVALAKAQGAEPADPLKTPLAEARQQQHRYFEILGGTPPEVLSVQEYSLETFFGRFATRLYFPSAERPLPVLVFMRGAGWWAGNLDSHDRTMRLLANKSGMAVCGVDYHCAPEACFPTQLDELLATVQWLRETGLQTGVDGSRMVLVGESAGATLAALAAVKLKADQVQGLVLFYGNFAGPSLQSRDYSRWVWANFLGSHSLPADPAAIPAQMDLKGLPPSWLGVGDCDPLVGDSIVFADRLVAAGVACQLRKYPGVPHAFVMMSRLFPGADSALTDAAQAARNFVYKSDSFVVD